MNGITDFKKIPTEQKLDAKHGKKISLDGSTTTDVDESKQCG